MCVHVSPQTQMLFSPSVMAGEDYFCARLQRRVNILMNVASIDLLPLLCHTVSLLWSFHPAPSSAGSLSVSEVAGLLEQETLRRLKKECGGLQTLLKNNHQVFRGSRTRHTSSQLSLNNNRGSLFIYCSLYCVTLIPASCRFFLFQWKEGGCTSETGGTGRPPGRVPRGRRWPPGP